jgi:hypothetical protein
MIIKKNKNKEILDFELIPSLNKVIYSQENR